MVWFVGRYNTVTSLHYSYLWDCSYRPCFGDHMDLSRPGGSVALMLELIDVSTWAICTRGAFASKVISPNLRHTTLS